MTHTGVKALRDALDTVADSPAKSEWVAMLDSLPTSASGTLKSWAQSRDGATVRTYQWRVKDDGRPFGTWAPGPRTIDARATYATFDGSRRGYRGVRVVAADDDAILIASDEWDGVQLCAYIVAQ